MRKTLRGWLVSVLSLMCCAVVGAGIVELTPAAADGDDVVYDKITLSDLSGKNFALTNNAWAFTATEDEIRTTFTPSTENTTNSVSLSFDYTVLSTVADGAQALDIRIGGTGWDGYLFKLYENGTLYVVDVGEAKGWKSSVIQANKTQRFELGVVRNADSTVRLFVNVDGNVSVDETVAEKENCTNASVNFYAGGTVEKTLTSVVDTENKTETTKINGLVLGTWAKENSTADLLYIDVLSDNLPQDVNFQSNGLKIQKDGAETSVGSIYAAGKAGLLGISGISATEGTKLTVPKNASFTVGTITYVFDEEYSVWFNGTSWQTEEYKITPSLVSYTDEQLEKYDVVTPSFIGLQATNSFAAGNTDLSGKGYTASAENTTGSVKFRFVFRSEDCSQGALDFRLRGEAWSGILFRIGETGNKISLFGTERLECSVESNKNVAVEFGAIDVKDSDLIWLYVKTNDTLCLSTTVKKTDNNAALGTDTFSKYTSSHLSIYAGGVAAWTISDPEGTGVVTPDVPSLPTYTDSELAKYDVFSVKEIFGTRELCVFGGEGYAQNEKTYTLSADNTTNSVVFKFSVKFTGTLGAGEEKLITLRSQSAGAYGYRFYVDPLKTTICDNWTGIAENMTADKTYVKVGEVYDIEIGAINLADDSGVWLYIKLDGDLVCSNVRAKLSNEGEAICIGSFSATDWLLRDANYDNLPEEEAQVKTGLSTKKSDLLNEVTVIDLEDAIAKTAYTAIGFGAYKTDAGNIWLKRTAADDRTPIIELKMRDGEKIAENTAIKFTSINECTPADQAKTATDPWMKTEMKQNTAIELGLELCAPNMGTYWAEGNGYLVYLVWDVGNEDYKVRFYPQGPQTSTDGITVLDLTTHSAFDKNFLPIGEKYTIEYGLFSENSGKDLTMYILITNADGEEMYVANTWSAENIGTNATEGGYVRIASLPYERCADVQLLPVDETTNLFAEYKPEYEEATKVVDHDISDYLPIGKEGITYTTTSDTDTKDIINVRKFIVNTKNEMYLQFTGDYNLRLAFFTDRSTGNCSAGYHVVFTPTEIRVESYRNETVQVSEKVANTIPLNTKTHVSIRATQLFNAGVLQAIRLSVFVDGEEVVCGDFALQLSSLPTYFDGIMSGNGSVTILPYDSKVTTAENEITIKAAKKVVAVDKKVKLVCESAKPIVGEKITYKIVEGAEYAEIVEKDGSFSVLGKKDGVVKVVAVITNEFGTFESEALEITVGTGVAETPADSTASGNGLLNCFGSIEGCSSLCVAALAFGVIALFAKKKED